MKSAESRAKMSKSAKRRCTDEWRKNKSDEYRTKIDDEKLKELYQSGMTQLECANALGVGRKVIANAFKRLGIKSRKAAKRDQWGEKNTGWKGDEAGLLCLHKRLYRAFGQPSRCDVCGTADEAKTYDWANLTGKYTDPTDYKRMCRSCHAKYDKKFHNFKGKKGGKGKRGTRVI